MKVFESPSYIMTIYPDNYLQFCVKKDVMLSEENLWQSKKDAESYKPGEKYYVLVTGEEYFQVTKEAREVVASVDFSNHIHAVALFHNELPMKILGNLYISINKPVVPTRFFNDMQKAKEWLMKQK